MSGGPRRGKARLYDNVVIAYATAAAASVAKKFTVWLLIQPRRCRVAPRMLSISIPANPAATGIQSWAQGTIPPTVATAAITTPDAKPATLPAIVMPPSVPGGTRSQVVIIRASGPRYGPISLATVSVAASERAATAPINQTPFPVALKTTELR